MQGLTQVEEMLNLSITTRHVVNLPQDVVSFAQSLPRLPANLDMLVVRKDNPFMYGRSVVQQAVSYLLENNKYYIANAVHLNVEATYPKMVT